MTRNLKHLSVTPKTPLPQNTGNMHNPFRKKWGFCTLLGFKGSPDRCRPKEKHRALVSAMHKLKPWKKKSQLPKTELCAPCSFTHVQ